MHPFIKRKSDEICTSIEEVKEYLEKSGMETGRRIL